LSLEITSFASVPDQPFMQAARADLQKARAALQRAEHNKGGHRANAIRFINSAVNEIDRGIRYDRTHIRRRRHHADENFLRSAALVVDQPNMRSALEHLQNAKRDLQSATATKVDTGKMQLTWSTGPLMKSIAGLLLLIDADGLLAHV